MFWAYSISVKNTTESDCNIKTRNLFAIQIFLTRFFLRWSNHYCRRHGRAVEFWDWDKRLIRSKNAALFVNELRHESLTCVNGSEIIWWSKCLEVILEMWSDCFEHTDKHAFFFTMIVVRRPPVLGHFCQQVNCVILTSMQPCFNTSISNRFYKLGCQFCENCLPLQLDHNTSYCFYNLSKINRDFFTQEYI